MGAMIFWLIKLSEGMNLIQYAIQNLKNHKFFINGPKIKTTIFGKEKVRILKFYPKILVSIQFKSPKRSANRKICLKMTFKWPLCNLKRSRSHFWSNWWFYWTQEAKTYRKRVFIIILGFFKNLFEKLPKNVYFHIFKLAKRQLSLEFILC